MASFVIRYAFSDKNPWAVFAVSRKESQLYKSLNYDFPLTEDETDGLVNGRLVGELRLQQLWGEKVAELT